MAKPILFLMLLAPVAAHVSQGRTQHGLIGYGIHMYDPACAFACRDTVTSWMLDCGDAGTGGHSHHEDMELETPSPLCYATNDPFLQTLAWCISTHCEDDPIPKLESWWEKYLVGRTPGQPSPKTSYQKALNDIQNIPTSIVNDGDILNRTSLVNEDMWLANFNGDHGYDITEATSSTYGLVLLLSCCIIPIVLSLMRFLPLSHTFVSKFYAYCIDPPLFDRYHAVPVMGLAIVPTRGQALFIAYIWIMNIILSAVGYNLTWPNSWYGSKTEEITAFVGNRAGVLSFANLGLVMLYSSRNNILLYLTNWSHATFLLVHRWLAFGCTVQACLHSAVWLQIYVKQSAEVHAKEAALEYWIWGVIATLALVVMLPLSLLPIRRKTYEVFLASHVVLAILSMIGCLLHIYYRFTWQWGYETWVYVAFVIWGFDRFIARPLRIFRNGFKKAYTTVIDEDYLMIHIPGVDASGVAYLYFPTLSWRFWENHPFSVAAVADQGPMREASRLGSDRASSVLFNNSEKAHHAIVSRPLANLSHDAGIIFYIRRRNGLTSRLEVYSSSHNGTLVLVESSYRPVQITISPLSTAKRCLVYPNTVFIAGGVGITALLPLLNQANASLCPLGTIKLFWGVRSEPLVLSVEELLGKSGTRTKSRAKWGHIDVAVSIGERFHLAELLELELRQNKGGTTVVVCGPAGMADDARLVVTGLARHGIAVRFSEESFSW